jgi:hypothetical protein
VTVAASKSSVFARRSDGLNLGGGQDDHLISGYHASAGYRYRSAIQFSLPGMAGWTRIVRAYITLRGVENVHAPAGSAPRIFIYRAVATWTANASGETWGTGATVYPGPGATSTGKSTLSPPGNTAAWNADITAIAEAWRAGSANYGVLIVPQTEEVASQTVEFWSKTASTASYRPTLTIEYEEGVAAQPPSQPMLAAPGGQIGTLTPTFAFSASDPAGGPMLGWWIDLAYLWDSGFSQPLWTGEASAGINGWSVAAPYTGQPLGWGNTYQWRARVRNAVGWSSYSAVATFTTVEGNVPPYQPQFTEPYGTTTGEVDAPSVTVRVAFNSGDPNSGQSMMAWAVQVTDDPSFGYALISTGDRVDGITGWSVAATLDIPAEHSGKTLYIRAAVADSAGQTSGWSPASSFAIYRPVTPPPGEPEPPPPPPTEPPPSETPLPAFDPTPYRRWAQYIIDNMAESRSRVRVVTVRPRDSDVEIVACAEYGDLFRIQTDDIDRLVRVIGLKATVSRDGWFIDLVTEDA